MTTMVKHVIFHDCAMIRGVSPALHERLYLCVLPAVVASQLEFCGGETHIITRGVVKLFALGGP